ncbi:FAD-binding molybdopterin dehydrogenase [Actinophytocola xinjiangensis]|uniref:FAD-binding molybdopterin dehydrogenase n=1 Tax=Actinophytocola xinjiangensis TaxID=485602 RepID=A0A7Z1B1S9_9PSEU|nr:xanthine dehydrogenase family protein subunit M [Actinophytocola xinjiangensis]OLF14347.1 FAD-binding molybdopterin dehydrogenase [Actinophytocola xinjiangensis]
MRPFTYASASTVEEALAGAGADSAYLAGGTTLVDLMKLEVMSPAAVLNIDTLPLRDIRHDHTGLHVGALARMSDVAAHRLVTARYPVISQALLHSASPQLRNMASIGGNVLQRTRCGYFRDPATACNKRTPGSGCAAITGYNRAHAVLGTSESCVATHPSDLAVALVALDASVLLRDRAGERAVRLADFYLLPGDTPHLENRLRPGELLAGVTVPPLSWARRSTYVKVRDRRPYEFALTSVAAAVDLRGDTIADVRLAAGGVGTKPWRLPAVEDALRSRPLRADTVKAAVTHAADDATPLSHNGFKPELLRRTIVRALLTLAGRP